MHATCGHKTYSLRVLPQDNQLTGGLPPLWGGWGKEGLPALRVLNLSNNPVGARSGGWLAKEGPLTCSRSASVACRSSLPNWSDTCGASNVPCRRHAALRLEPAALVPHAARAVGRPACWAKLLCMLCGVLVAKECTHPIACSTQSCS